MRLSKLQTLLSLGLFALALPLWASASESEPASPIQWSPLHFKISPWASHHTSPFADVSNRSGRLDAEAEIKASIDGEGGSWTAKLVPWTWVNSPEPASSKKKNAQFFFEAKEGWLERSTPDWDFRVGNQILAWGSADKINPVDQFNPIDYTDPFRSFKLPRGAGRLVIHPTALPDYTLELVFSPFFRDPKLPIDIPSEGSTPLDLKSSRWLSPVPRSVNISGINFPLLYRIQSPTYSATWHLGTRLGIMHVGPFDFSLNYVNGVESIPRFGVTVEGTANSPTLPLTATLHPSYHRFQLWGIDGSGSLSLSEETQIGTRFEVAFTERSNARVASADARYRNDLIKDDFIHGVLGFDYTLPKPVLDSTLYLNLQLVVYETLQNAQIPTGTYVLKGLPTAQTFDRNAVLYVENRWETWRLGQSVLGSAQHGDFYYSPALHHTWSDQLTTTLSGDFFLGSTKGFFGQFYEDSRVALSASIEF